MSYTQTYYHIVFSTKNRRPVLAKESREKLFRYMWGILKNKRCHLYRVNGVEDHVHVFTSLHSTVALADLIRELKTSTTDWIRKERIFADFECWQAEYAAFTKSHEHKDAVIEYVKSQEEHHRSVSFQDELKELLREAGIVFDERYLN